MNENKIELPLANPFITSYPKYAHLFSIVGCANEVFLWVAKHLLLVHSYEYKTHMSIDLGGFDKDAFDDNPHPNGPLLEDYKIPFSSLSSNLKEDLIKFLYNGFFICVNVDTSKFIEYSPWKLIHPVLISGYSDDKFKINDFFPPTSNYTQKDVFWHCLSQGIKFSGFNYLLLYKKKELNFNLYDYKQLFAYTIIEGISKILNGSFIPVNPFYFKTSQLVQYKAGLDCYDHIVSNLFEFSRKSLHVLYDSKKILMKCLSILTEYNLLRAEYLIEYQEIMDKIFVLRNLYIKYELTKSVKYYNYIIEHLQLIKEKEKVILNKIVDNIKDNISYNENNYLSFYYNVCRLL